MTPTENCIPASKSDSTAFLCINFGSPDSLNLSDTYRFLVEIFDGVSHQPPSFLEKILSRLIYAPFALLKTKKRYQAIYSSSGFPLKTHSIQLVSALNKAFPQNRPSNMVYIAMQHGSPSIEKICNRLQELSYQRIVIIPLYPQKAPKMTDAICNRVHASLSNLLSKSNSSSCLSINYIKDFHLRDWYIDPFAQMLKKHAAEHDAVLFSYHSVLEKESSFYNLACHETSEKIMAKSEISLPWRIGYQSKPRGGNWLKPESRQVVSELAKKGKKSLLVIAPGFITPCTETLLDIEQELKALFLKKGGLRFDLLPPLCTNSDFINNFALFLANTSKMSTYTQTYPLRTMRQG